MSWTVSIRNPYRCYGACGKGTICAPIMFIHGYCFEPNIWLKMVKRFKDEAIQAT